MHMQKNKLSHFLTPYIKINSNCPQILVYVRAKTIRLLEKDIGINSHGLGVGGQFLRYHTTEQRDKNKKQINWTSSKLRTFMPQITH